MSASTLIPELSVGNLAESLAFYCGMLGFSLRYGRPEEGFAFVELGQAALMLDQIGLGRDWVTGSLERPLGRDVNFQVEVPALAPLLIALEGGGVPLFLPVETRTYSVAGRAVTQRQFCVQDPDGYLLRFFEVA